MASSMRRASDSVTVEKFAPVSRIHSPRWELISTNSPDAEFVTPGLDRSGRAEFDCLRGDAAQRLKKRPDIFAVRAAGLAAGSEAQGRYELARGLAVLTEACQRGRQLIAGFPLHLRNRIRG